MVEFWNFIEDNIKNFDRHEWKMLVGLDKKEKFNLKKTNLSLRRVTVCAMFISIALVLKTAFSIQIPLFGQNGMSIGISGIFSMLPAFLFGPVYGAVTSGLVDVLGHFLKPMGPYLPQMTVIMALGGFLRGLLWKWMKNFDTKKMRVSVMSFSVALLILGVINQIFLNADGIDKNFYERVSPEQVNTENMHFVSKMLITRTIGTKNPSESLATYLPFVTIGLIGAAVLGMILLGADLLISKKMLHDSTKGQTMQILTVLIVVGLIVTTLNTVLLREVVFASWKALPFSVLWIPRVIEELIGNTVKAYFVVLLMGVFHRQKKFVL